MTPPTNAEPPPLSPEEFAKFYAATLEGHTGNSTLIEERLLATLAARDVEIEGLRERLARQDAFVIASKAASHHINLDDGSECHYAGVDSGEWYQCDGDCEVAIELWREWQAALDALGETSE